MQFLTHAKGGVGSFSGDSLQVLRTRPVISIPRTNHFYHEKSLGPFFSPTCQSCAYLTARLQYLHAFFVTVRFLIIVVSVTAILS